MIAGVVLAIALLLIAICIGMIAWGNTSHLHGRSRLIGFLGSAGSVAWAFSLAMLFPICACLFVGGLISLPFLLQGVFGYSDEVAVPLCLAGMVVGPIIALIAVRVIEHRAGWMDPDEDADEPTVPVEIVRESPDTTRDSDSNLKGQP